jgi:hypothetical protein
LITAMLQDHVSKSSTYINCKTDVTFSHCHSAHLPSEEIPRQTVA